MILEASRQFNINSIYKPFEWQVWQMIGGVILASAGIYFIVEVVPMRRNIISQRAKHYKGCKRGMFIMYSYFKFLVESFIWSFMEFLGNAPDMAHKANTTAAKALIISMRVFGIVVIAAYTAKLTLIYTNSNASLNINSVDDLVGRKVGTLAATTVEEFLTYRGGMLVYGYTDVYDMCEALAKFEVDAIVYDSNTLRWWVNDHPNYKIVGARINEVEDIVGYAVPPNSIYLDSINQGILSVQDSTQERELLTKWFPNKQSTTLLGFNTEGLTAYEFLSLYVSIGIVAGAGMVFRILILCGVKCTGYKTSSLLRARRKLISDFIFILDNRNYYHSFDKMEHSVIRHLNAILFSLHEEDQHCFKRLSYTDSHTDNIELNISRIKDNSKFEEVVLDVYRSLRRKSKELGISIDDYIMLSKLELKKHSNDFMKSRNSGFTNKSHISSRQIQAHIDLLPEDHEDHDDNHDNDADADSPGSSDKKTETDNEDNNANQNDDVEKNDDVDSDDGKNERRPSSVVINSNVQIIDDVPSE
eukprot:TRINITY_DN1852_c1_g1_i1.p1 TRINITY_DN1852_c1_g1~~TRINITY_DN1852_c1_g1_i1.p1  ORF type:complete len:530 (+),score=112.30 TRINITY_DN1852_c1_g1_i1:431-2020(+)